MPRSRANELITASIEYFVGRARMMMLSVAIATIACTLVVLVGVPGASVREADANHVRYSNISGKLTYQPQGRTVSGGAVYLYRWSGGRWVNMGKKATSNRYGYYTIKNARTGYYYKVQAYKTYASCYTGMAIYNGYSGNLDLRNPASSRAVAHISLYFQRYFYC